MQKKNIIRKLFAIAMFVFACIAFAMYLCDYAEFGKYADMIFRTLLLIYLLLYMKVK